MRLNFHKVIEQNEPARETDRCHDKPRISKLFLYVYIHPLGPREISARDFFREKSISRREPCTPLSSHNPARDEGQNVMYIHIYRIEITTLCAEPHSSVPLCSSRAISQSYNIYREISRAMCVYIIALASSANLSPCARSCLQRSDLNFLSKAASIVGA